MPPKAVPVNRNLDDLAPAVKRAALKVLAGMKGDGHAAIQFDTRRTNDRQAWLFGKGRTPEQCIEAGIAASWAWPACPDGRVTKAAHATQSWHSYGLAVDIIENDASPWVASQAFWNAVGSHAAKNALNRNIRVSGNLDLPHCQWAKCPVSPDASDALLLKEHGIEAVWTRYGAS